MNMKLMTIVVAMSAGALFGSVFDDAAFIFKPEDVDGDGVIRDGEVFNGLKGGVSHASNGGIVYGYDVNRAYTNIAVSSAYVSGNLSGIHFADVQEPDDTTHWWPGNIKASAAIQSVMPASSTAATFYSRTKCQDVNRNTSWIMQGGFPIGFKGNCVRYFYGGGDSEEDIADLPVANNEWIDLACTVTWQPELVNGVSVTTGKIHFVMIRSSNPTKVYTHDHYLTANRAPTSKSAYNIASENIYTSELTSKPAKTKYFKGTIQELMLWNRQLSDDEILEAFHVSDPLAMRFGVANGSSDEFGGTAGAAVAFDATNSWRTVPATIAAEQTWTISGYQLGSDFATSRNLVFVPLAGTTGKLRACVNGGTKHEVEVSAVHNWKLNLAAANFVEGMNTITLTCTEGSLGLDAMYIEEGPKTKQYVYTADTTLDKTFVETIAADEVLEIVTVGNILVKLDGASISGAGKLIKTGKGTLQFRSGAQSLTGGVDVEEGIASTLFSKAYNGICRGGKVRVFADNGAKLQIGASFTNDIEVVGNSTANLPAIAFNMGTCDDYAITNTGTITASGDVYVSDGWAAYSERVNEAHVVQKGAVNMTGGKLAWAPNMQVRFEGAIIADTLKGYYNNDNRGSFLLCSQSNQINKVEIDQTRVICGVNYCFGKYMYLPNDATWGNTNLNTVISFTGEHLADGLGCLDLNGFNTQVRRIETPNTLTADSEGCQVLSAKAATLYYGKLATPSASTTYAKFDGALSLTTIGNSGQLTMMPRHHTMSGTISCASPFVCKAGVTLENVTSIGGNNAASVSLDALGENALRSLTSIGGGSSISLYLNCTSTPPRQLAINVSGVNGSSFANSGSVRISGGEYEVKSLYYYDKQEVYATDAYKAWEEADKPTSGELFKAAKAEATKAAHLKNAPIGRYSAGGPFGNGQILSGSSDILVTTGALADSGVPITWKGAAGDTDMASAANWQDGEGVEYTRRPDTYYGPVCTATFAESGSAAVCSGTNYFYGLIFQMGASGGKSFCISGDTMAELMVYSDGIVCNDALDAGTSYEISAPITLNGGDMNLSIPSNGVFRLTGGISGTGNVMLFGGNQTNSTVGTSPNALPLAGSFYLDGTNDFDGTLTASGCVLHVKGVLGRPNEAAAKLMTFVISGGWTQSASSYSIVHGCVAFEGADVKKRVQISSLGMSNGVSNTLAAVAMAANTTNTFANSFRIGASNNLYFKGGSRTVFNDTFYCSASEVLHGDSGAEVVFNGAIDVNNSNKDGISFVNCVGITGDFNGTGGKVNKNLVLGYRGNRFNVNADNPMWVAQYLQFGDNTEANGTCTLSLNDWHEFTVAGLRALATSIVAGTGTLTVTGGVAGTTHSAYAKGKFTEGANLKLDLVDDGVFTFHGTSVNTSTGLLSLLNGQASFADGATWGGDIRVNGGTMNLASNLRMAENAALYIGDSTTPAAPGSYGAVGSGATHEVNWITGNGKLRVKVGTMLIIK